jgi:formaldehyde-activating enzyme involved in methanogenesis
MSTTSDASMITGSASEAPRGTYTFALSDVAEGHYSLSLNIIPDTLTKPITIEVERNIPMQQGMGMLGMGSSSTSWIVTGALMATMMIAVWFVKGAM